MKELISIIIPIYNTEKYLEKCINSVISQTYENIEIILINDGSTNECCVNICKRFEMLDNKVKFYDKNNNGVSETRNFGIEKSKGKYLIFIDSDDWIEKDTIKILYENIKNNDLSICSYRRVYDNFLISYKEEQLKKNIILDKNQTLKILFLNGKYQIDYQGFIFNKLFKKEIIDKYHIRFAKDIRYNEDRMFIFNYLLHCNKKIYFSKYIGYNYYKRQGSATNQKKYNEKMYTEFIAFEKMSELALNNGFKGLDNLIKNEYINHSLQTFIKYNYLSDYTIKKYINNTYKYLKQVLLSINVNLRSKLSIIKKYLIILYIEKLKKKKKLAILTINDDSNLGNRLQNYATQEILKKYKIKVETISNQKGIVGKGYIKKKIKTQIKKVIVIRPQIKKYNNFVKFNKNIKYSKYHIDIEHVPQKLGKKYDYYITGSDQVWNPNFNRMSDIDFLKFAPKEKRNSFSASFGIREIPDELKEYYKNNLLEMQNISVREDRAKEIIKELTGRTDVEVLIDPTMMLTAEEWDKVSKKPKNLKENKYILNYFLGDLSEKRRKEIERIANKNNCTVINLMDKNEPLFVSGPSEFLYLIKNAFMICTDSYHGSVFSIIYNKPFVVFNREDDLVNMNSRLETLLSKFQLQERYCKDGKIPPELLKCDYTKSYKILETEKEKVRKYIEKILNYNIDNKE